MRPQILQLQLCFALLLAWAASGQTIEIEEHEFTAGRFGAKATGDSDYVLALPHSIRHWVAGEFHALGTDGFGRSEGRAVLRDYFEVDHRHVAWTALTGLRRQGKLDAEKLTAARRKLGIDPDKADPTAF